MQYKISIITPVYNAEKYIKRCIESVCNQTYTNIEHIIVNDGSTDATPDICDELARKNNKIKIIHKKNEGVSKARNVGIELATGDYILFADADDWLENSMCEKMLDVAIKTNSDIVMCEYYNFYEKSQFREHIKLEKISNISFTELIGNDKKNYGGFPWNKLIKTNKIKKKFNENIHFYENLLFFLENFDAKTSYQVLLEPLYNYCINENSAVHSKKFNPKKITTMDALLKIIPLLNGSNKLNYMSIFINSYYLFYYDFRKNKLDTDIIKNYTHKKNDYYNYFMSSKKTSFKLKVKIFVITKLTFIYYMLKYIKGKQK